MRGLGLTVACVVLSTGAVAQAQTITAVGQTNAAINYSSEPGTRTDYPNGDSGATHSADGKRWPVGMLGNRLVTAAEKKGGSFEAIVDITGSHVSFESGTAASGPYSTSTSFSGVDVTVSNLTNSPISIDNFGSTIIPAGLGFYLLDRSTPFDSQMDGRGNVFTGYGQTNSGLTFGDLATDPSLNLGSTVGFGSSNPFAYADFDFQIMNQNTEQSLYHLTGSLSMYLDENYNVRQGWNLTNASLALSGFTGVHGTPTDHDVNLNDRLSYGFAWDATDIVLPLNAFLEQNSSVLLSYQTRVTSYTRTGCLTLNVCLVAYSGFGDPIGRGGGVDSLAQFSTFGDMDMIDTPLNDNFDSPITGIVFDPVEFDPFRVITTGVPEPATWMTMIMGFGLLGASLRRRRTAFARI